METPYTDGGKYANTSEAMLGMFPEIRQARDAFLERMRNGLEPEAEGEEGSASDAGAPDIDPENRLPEHGATED